MGKARTDFEGFKSVNMMRFWTEKLLLSLSTELPSPQLHEYGFTIYESTRDHRIYKPLQKRPSIVDEMSVRTTVHSPQPVHISEI